MPRDLRYLASAAAALLLLAALALAQRRLRVEDSADESSFSPREGEYHFIRVEYTDLPQFSRRFGYSSRFGRGRGWWLVDWPDADEHFSVGIQRLTRIDIGEPRHLGLTDEKLFDYPWIYATQVGYWDLSDAETARLREYLLRGGFLVVDDFWGPEEWEIFRQTMERVLPNHTITDLAESDPLMHVLYDIREKDRTFIPGSRHLRRGPDGTIQVVQPPGTAPAWRGMFDDRDRLAIAVNYQTDMADAWEFADVPYYPAPMTLLAYHYGINYIVYSMTH